MNPLAIFLGAASAVAAASTAAAGAGPDMGSASSSVVDDIIVTAEKRATTAQATPIALTVLDTDALNLRGIQNVEALVRTTPSIRFYETVQQGFVTIRGVGGERNTTPAGDPSVAIHIDGVYQARNNAAALTFYDVERIEVLRGPQGTLYGRNATGGTINIITRSPDLEEPSGGVDLLVGNYSNIRARGYVSMPLIQGKLGLRLRGIYEDRDGFTRNLAELDGSEDLQDAGTRSISGQLRFEPNDRLRVDIRGDYLKVDARGSTEEARGPFGNPALTAPPPFGYGAPPEPPEPLVTFIDIPQIARTDTWGISGTLEVGDIGLPVLGTATWVSIIAYRNADVPNRSDADRTGAALTDLRTRFDQRQFSIETRLVSDNGGPLSWQLGYFFISENNLANPNLNFFRPNGAIASNSNISMDVDSKSHAVFGQATFSVTDTIRITAGLRHTWDDKDVVQRFRITSPQLPAPLDISVPQQESWSALTGKLGMEADVGPSNLLYGSYSRGYKAGGFGLNQPAYDPEYIDAFEIGSKNRFADGALQVNFAGFHYKQTDQQVGFYTDGLLPGAPSILVQNAAQSRTWGAELEMVIAPLPDLQFNLGLTYLDAQFTDYQSVDPADPIKRSVPGCGALPPNLPAALTPPECLNTVDLSGSQQPLAPKWAITFGAQKDLDLGSRGTLTPRVDFTWTDRFLLRQFGRPEDRQADAINLDLVIRWRDASDRFTVEAFARNVTDERVAAATSWSPNSQAIGATYLAPRTYGVTAGVAF